MQQQTKGHRLNEIWAVEDAVNNATQSAAIAQQYHKLTSLNVSAVSLEIDQLTHRLNHATAQINRLEGLINDSRTHCLVWGIGGTIVSSLVMSLFMAQFNPPQRIEARSVTPMQSAIVESAPQVQKLVIKAKTFRSVARRKG